MDGGNNDSEVLREGGVEPITSEEWVDRRTVSSSPSDFKIEMPIVVVIYAQTLTAIEL